MKMKVLLFYFVVALSFAIVPGQNWVNSARFKNFASYYPNLMLQTLYEVETYGWWNLRLNPINYNINIVIYDRNFEGYANYTNGFLVSIQRIDFKNLMQTFMQGSVTGTITGTMNGLLELHDVTVGYDVFARLENQDHHFTGTFNHRIVQYTVSVTKNLNTSEITTNFWLTSLGSHSGDYMQYLPQTDISDVIQRFYLPSDNWDGVASWGNQIFATAMTRLMGEDELGFPEVCFYC